MKMLIDKSDLVNYKWDNPIPLECERCHKTFFYEKHFVQTVLKSNSNRRKYCSEKCMRLARRRRIDVQCGYCKKSIIIKPYRLKFTNQFCSCSCRNRYNNTHKTKGGNRSKLEKWIEEQLTTNYPNLQVDYNKTNAINAELDIYIPSLKLAFELNGIFHYEPIYGKEKLQQTQTNDHRKFQACSEKGIGLCVIDTHHSTYLKEERDRKFLNIITDIIDPLLTTK